MLKSAKSNLGHVTSAINPVTNHEQCSNFNMRLDCRFTDLTLESGVSFPRTQQQPFSYSVIITPRAMKQSMVIKGNSISVACTVLSALRARLDRGSVQYMAVPYT